MILMRCSSDIKDKRDRHLYKKEFEQIVKSDFVEEDEDFEEADQFYRV